MKISVIDIGSNSVRLMMWADGKTLYKRINTTRLGEGLAFSGALSDAAVSRTVSAISRFKEEAVTDGAQKVYAFATEAVRSAENGGEFVRRVLEECAVEVDVLSGEEEAKIGLAGALGDGDGGIIDVGGASTEITIRRGGEIIYAKSVGLGAVRLHDMAGRDYARLCEIVKGRVSEYGSVPCEGITMYSIGGTSTRFAAFSRGISEYDAELLHGTRLSLGEVDRLSRVLTSLSVEEIAENKVCKSAADIVGGGAVLYAVIMQTLKIPEIVISERDNLEGYVLNRVI